MTSPNPSYAPSAPLSWASPYPSAFASPPPASAASSVYGGASSYAGGGGGGGGGAAMGGRYAGSATAPYGGYGAPASTSLYLGGERGGGSGGGGIASPSGGGRSSESGKRGKGDDVMGDVIFMMRTAGRVRRASDLIPST